MDVDILDEVAMLSPFADGREFVVAGLPRGLHFVQATDHGEVYSARLDVEGVLPTLLCRRDVPGTDPPGALFGPLAYEAGDDAHKGFVIYTDGHGFGKDLLEAAGVELALRAVEHDLVSLEVRPAGDASRVHLDVRTGGDRNVTRRGIELAQSLFIGADYIAARDRRYENAWEHHEKDPVADPSDDVLSALVARVQKATSWVTGHTSRVGHALSARVVLHDAGPELHGTLHVRWRDAAGTIVEVDLDGSLPERKGEHADLTPERGGFAGFLARLGETHVGDAPLDNAYVIDAEPGAKPLLLRARAPLTELGAYNSRFTFDDTRVSSAVRDVPTTGDALEQVIDGSLRVWRAAALYRSGFDVGQHDPFAR